MDFCGTRGVGFFLSHWNGLVVVLFEPFLCLPVSGWCSGLFFSLFWDQFLHHASHQILFLPLTNVITTQINLYPSAFLQNELLPFWEHGFARTLFHPQWLDHHSTIWSLSSYKIVAFLTKLETQRLSPKFPGNQSFLKCVFADNAWSVVGISCHLLSPASPSKVTLGLLGCDW